MADQNIFTVTGRGLDDLGTQLFDPEKWGRQQANSMGAGVAAPASTLGGLYASMAPGMLAGAARQQAKNPYNTGIADQSRGAQLALLQQMRGQAAGPSLAGMQGTQAMGQGLQAALRGASMGQPGRAMMVGAGQQGAGMASDVARARLAEQMRASAGMGGLAGGLRGNDLQSAQGQSGAGRQAQRLADEKARFYASQGSSLFDASRRSGLETFKVLQRLQQQQTGRARQTGQDAAQGAATVLDIIF